MPGATSTIVRTSSPSIGNVPSSINDADQVIGRYVDGTGGHTFLCSDGNYTTLDVPGTTSTTATEINNAGQVLGTYVTGSVTRPFLYSDGTYTTLAVPGATSTNVLQLNDAGQVAGTCTNQTGTHLFLDTDGTYATIDSPFGPTVPSSGSTSFSASFNQLSNTGDVLGVSFGNTPLGGSEPFLYFDGTSADASVPGAAFTTITRINDLGQLTGTFYDGLANHSFLATPLSTDATQAVMPGDLLPATPGTAAVTQDNTDPGPAPSAPVSDNSGLNAQLALLNDQSSFGTRASTHQSVHRVLLAAHPARGARSDPQRGRVPQDGPYIVQATRDRRPDTPGDRLTVAESLDGPVQAARRFEDIAASSRPSRVPPPSGMLMQAASALAIPVRTR